MNIFVNYLKVFCSVFIIGIIPLSLSQLGVDLDQGKCLALMFVFSTLASGNILWQLGNNDQ